MNDCPSCGDRLTVMANVDSDDRINFTWRRCGNCRWDERNLNVITLPVIRIERMPDDDHPAPAAQGE